MNKETDGKRKSRRLLPAQSRKPIHRDTFRLMLPAGIGWFFSAIRNLYLNRSLFLESLHILLTDSQITQDEFVVLPD